MRLAQIKNYYLKEIKLKIERTAPEKKVKEKLNERLELFYQQVEFKSVKVVIDVDPL